ncbi:hypothetical protein BpHYR1_016344 [Brachionus plicatilis]|uniref:Uncharacterized protein n=1 Tax=Brachionus plicatilis TaxID=10195 RepID=A0A3M7P3L5_BRAPC|nr:hypothetical protein BpHYR1_016344 [Brachionus plicatilis]
MRIIYFVAIFAFICKINAQSFMYGPGYGGGWSPFGGGGGGGGFSDGFGGGWGTDESRYGDGFGFGYARAPSDISSRFLMVTPEEEQAQENQSRMLTTIASSNK